MTIAAILESKGDEVVTIAPDASVGDAVSLLVERRIGAVLVTDGEVVLGVLSERDVVHCISTGDLDARVDSVMTAPVMTVSPGDAVIGALSLMTQRRFRHLPVTDNGRLVGIVSIGDLVKYRIDRIEAEATAMRDYIQQA